MASVAAAFLDAELAGGEGERDSPVGGGLVDGTGGVAGLGEGGEVGPPPIWGVGAGALPPGAGEAAGMGLPPAMGPGAGALPFEAGEVAGGVAETGAVGGMVGEAVVGGGVGVGAVGEGVAAVGEGVAMVGGEAGGLAGGPAEVEVTFTASFWPSLQCWLKVHK